MKAVKISGEYDFNFAPRRVSKERDRRKIKDELQFGEKEDKWMQFIQRYETDQLLMR